MALGLVSQQSSRDRREVVFGGVFGDSVKNCRRTNGQSALGRVLSATRARELWTCHNEDRVTSTVPGSGLDLELGSGEIIDSALAFKLLRLGI